MNPQLTAILKRLRDEPVLLTTLVGAVINLLVAFGLELTDAQTVAVLAVINGGLAIFARSQVAPVKALEELAAESPDTVEVPVQDQIEGVEDEDTLDGHVPRI